jgi:D-alanyl-D-alanine carboxypeptidase
LIEYNRPVQTPRASNVFGMRLLPGVLLIIWLLQGCQTDLPADVSPPIRQVSIQTPSLGRETPTLYARQEPRRPPTTTAIPTSTEATVATVQFTLTPTLLPTTTSRPLTDCNSRVPADDLLTLVTQDFGLSREYEPADLVPLADYLPQWSTLGYPTEIRQIIARPLEIMVNNMRAAGLRPTIISGYRSYAAQAIAWNKWLTLEPERASILSAPPGHSEHQLGTTVDFGSPELAVIVGQEDIEFHTYFYQTSEGIWLEEHAHEFGFVLSYPRDAFEITGFYYEPWHYRFVGPELATRLKSENLTLTEFLLEEQPLPCIPNSG